MTSEERTARYFKLQEVLIVQPDFQRLLIDLQKAGFTSSEIAMVAGVNPCAVRYIRTKGTRRKAKFSWALGEAIIELWERFCRGT
jgi:hypothetical protein